MENIFYVSTSLSKCAVHWECFSSSRGCAHHRSTPTYCEINKKMTKTLTYLILNCQALRIKVRFLKGQ